MPTLRPLVAATAMGLLGPLPSCSADPCTPEEHGLGDAQQLTIRRLTHGTANLTEACPAPGFSVIASEAELAKVYAELGVARAESDHADFASERVLVRRGIANQSMAWAVLKGEAAVVGLLTCRNATRSSCITELVVVSSTTPSRAESRTCEGVSCGAPVNISPR